MLNSAELVQRGHGTLSSSSHFKLFEMFLILDEDGCVGVTSRGWAVRSSGVQPWFTPLGFSNI